MFNLCHAMILAQHAPYLWGRSAVVNCCLLLGTSVQDHESCCQSTHRGEKFGLWLPWNQSHHPTPTPAVEPKDQGITRTWTVSEAQGSVVQKVPVLMPLYHKWPSSKVLQWKLSPPALLHTCSPRPLKTLNLVQWARWIWGTVRSPIFWIGAFLINKPFFNK